MTDAQKSLFAKIGLKKKQISTLSKNADRLEECITEAGVAESGCDAEVGKLLYHLATAAKMKSEGELKHLPTVARLIGEKKLDSVVKVNRAVSYCKKHSAFFWQTEFEEYSGVGVSPLSESELRAEISNVIQANLELMSSKGRAAMSRIFAQVNERLPFSDGKLKKAIIMELTGWDKPVDKKKRPKSGKRKKGKKGVVSVAQTEEKSEDLSTAIEKWTQGRDVESARNSDAQLESRRKGLEAMELSPDTFLTRFPPEPNGFLHIGHCKAMNFNFTLADKKGGHCYLRFDDTNPEAEEQVYIDSIVENAKWMGFKIWKVTHASERFEDLHRLALKLISKGYGYVCHQTQEQIEAERASFKSKSSESRPSPFRDTSVEENLRKFEQMRVGYYGAGEACLRMKGDIESDNPNMWDPVAYRIKYVPHPHVGDGWCIYPTYDFTHCVHDSLEWISASCCTLEFENRRESYFWLLDVLDLYKPLVWEYSRLNISYNVLSKRRLIRLVKGGFVRDWDDARMPTIDGLRRRGYTASILRDFCNRVGVTRKENRISPKLLESCAREELDRECRRAFAVVKPLKVVLTNFEECARRGEKTMAVQCSDFPQRKAESSKRKAAIGKVVYIDADDFRESADKKFFGMCVGRTVRLKYAFNVHCDKVVRDDDSGDILHVECTLDRDSANDLKGVKKGHLTWVSAHNALAAEFRIYDALFTVETPSSDWINELNADSETIHSGFVEPSVAQSEDSRFQFERVGYFVKDKKDYCAEAPVFNRIIPLRESASKSRL